MKHLLWCALFMALGGDIFSQFGDPYYLEPTFPDLHLCTALDYDQDGDDDIVMSSTSDTHLAFLEHTSPGIHHKMTLRSCSIFPVEEFYRADLNGDGSLDLVVYSDSLNAISAYVSNEGEISEEIPLFTDTQNFSQFKFADVNQDGLADFTYCSSFAVYTKINNGDFTFAATSILVNPVSDVITYVVGDTDYDTDIDVIVSTTTECKVYPRNAAGAYTAGSDITGATGATKLQLLDLMGTPSNDLIYVTSGFYWTLNNGSNSFIGQNYLQSGSDGDLTNYEALDVDDDGDKDLLKCHVNNSGTGGDFVIYLNSGSTFGGTNNITDTQQVGGGRFVLADMDQDGGKDVLICERNEISFDTDTHFEWLMLPDVVAASQSFYSISVFPQHLNRSPYGYIYDLQHGDMDGDGDEDMVMASSFKVSWYPNDGFGGFSQSPILIKLGDQVNLGIELKLNDFDLDGDIDIINSWHQYMNDGTGHFTDASFGIPTSIGSADMNNDGYLDYYNLTNTAFVINYGSAAGTFTASQMFHNYGTLYFVSSRVGAFSPDGISDDVLIAASFNGAVNYYLFRRAPNGTVTSSSLGQCNSINIAADFNHDGTMEMKCQNSTHWSLLNNFQYLQSSNQLNLDPEDVAYMNAEQAKSYFYGNIDGDLHTDVLLWNNNFNQDKVMWVEVNLSDLVQTVTYLNGDMVQSDNFLLVDLDGDGDPELANTLIDGTIAIRKNLFNNNPDHGVYVKAYHDTNGNGMPDAGEASIPELPVTVGLDQTIYYTSQDEFLFIPRNLGNYSLTASTGNDQWILQGTGEFDFALSNSNPYDTIYVAYAQNPSAASVSTFGALHMNSCSGTGQLLIGLSNDSGSPLDGQFTLDLDQNLVMSNSSFTPDSIVGTKIFWTVQNILSQDDSLFTIDVTGEADEDSIFSSKLRLFDGTGNLVSAQVISASYCQNLIANLQQVNGYDSAGFVPVGSNLIYSVMAQPNDSTSWQGFSADFNLEMDTEAIDVLYSNYPVSHQMQSDGSILFHFDEEIENANDAYFVVFSANTVETPPAGAVVTNNTTLYFNVGSNMNLDVFHTYYDCSINAEIATVQTVYCPGMEVEASDVASLYEEYEWTIVGEEVAIPFNTGEYESGLIQLVLTSDNAQCIDSDTTVFEITAAGVIELEYAPGDSVIYGSYSGVYTWYFNNEIVPNEQSDSLLITENGSYMASSFDQNGCAYSSSELFAVVVCPAGDVNCDGVVNSIDLDLLLANFGCVASCADLDLNGDQLVNVQDIIILMGVIQE